ncbi:MAG TPA: desulfoferrodoxin family protein, partial [bacterium]|nr:desulfoferrodoxin family protein [bacterium]
LIEKNIDEGMEKHTPVIEKIDGGYKVKIGSVPHPMEEAHYIEWIELIAGEKVYREYLKPGQAPEAVFMVDAENVSARAYCNIHGLWKS